MRGVIFAAGGARLAHRQWMIHGSISTLALARIQRILIVAKPQVASRLQQLLGDGARWGVGLSYAIQAPGAGLAHALLSAAEFIGHGPAALAHGGRLLRGNGLAACLRNAAALKKGARLYVCRVGDLGDADDSNALSVAEAGLYFYDNSVAARALALRQRQPGALEIDAINQTYRDQGNLQVVTLGDAMTCHDLSEDASPAAARWARILERRGAASSERA